MPSKRDRYDSFSSFDGDTAVHSRSDAVVDAAAGVPFEAVFCPLAELCFFDDIWERICYWMSGDALRCASQVTKSFRIASRKTPAFVLLAGINNDAKVVPWGSPSNVMSSKYIHLNCNLDDEMGREVVAIKTAERMLQNVAHPEYLRQKRVRLPRSYGCSGPARPSSPDDTAHYTFEPYIRPSYCCEVPRLNPPVFGVRAGFSYAPFWDVLIGESSDDSDA